MLSRLLKAKAKPNLEVLVLAGIGILFTGSGVFTWVEMGTFIGDQSGVHRVPVAGIIVGLLLILSSVVAWRGRCR